jgi:hypothetical protein
MQWGVGHGCQGGAQREVQKCACACDAQRPAGCRPLPPPLPPLPPPAPTVVMSSTRSSRWIHDIHCLPLPRGPPAGGGARCGAVARSGRGGGRHARWSGGGGGTRPPRRAGPQRPAAHDARCVCAAPAKIWNTGSILPSAPPCRQEHRATTQGKGSEAWCSGQGRATAGLQPARHAHGRLPPRPLPPRPLLPWPQPPSPPHLGRQHDADAQDGHAHARGGRA